MPNVPENLLQTLDYSVVQQCMHCGLCLPTCPTFDETGRERNSPRGRIALMRAVADSELPINRAFAEEMDYCVGCLACVSVCPAGVDYANLLETARAASEHAGAMNSPARSVYRWLGLRLLMTRPWLLRLIARFVALQQRPKIRKLLYRIGAMRIAPKRLRDLEPSAPMMDPPFSYERIEEVEHPKNRPIARVVLLIGCVQDIAFAKVNRATADVLSAIGCEVITPRGQVCCGSLHAHNGDLPTAKELARKTLDLFGERGKYPLGQIDAIISNSGGCGSHLRHYARLLKEDANYKAIALEWDAKVRDAQEFVAEKVAGKGILYPETGMSPKEPTRITYDASCHLCHGQQVVNQPVELLKGLPNTEFIPLAEADWCCGAAGVYSMTQPEQSDKLLQRKLLHLRQTGAEVLATANPGCLHQLRMACAADKDLKAMRVVHPMELLAEAMRC